MGGQGPIPYMTIRAYASDHGITGDDFRTFRTFMTIIDSEWMKHVAERDKADKEKGEGDGERR